MRKRVLLLIPAYNEQENIAKVIKGIKRRYPFDILVVNDGSLDRTEEIVRGLGERVISHPYNMGYGAALQTGFRYALRNNYAYIVQLDADGQHNPDYIVELLSLVEQDRADIVLGSRFRGKGRYNMPKIRLVGSLLFSWLTSQLISQKITDPTSGFQAINQRVMQFLVQTTYPEDYPDADTIIMLHRAGFRIAEIGVEMYRSPKKSSSLHRGLRPLYYIPKMFLSIFVNLLRRKERCP